ncbi:hypothetical protein LMORI2_02700 [Limnohabitans sp. MORI2]|uniref:rhamnan synthesis F family protein n=1 Tax=Limnohabitans sp. MORI2 TaxID=1751150 RepID=UPI0023779D39|nr:rhamnan synthesis F family protein [Limnohabitans sp. MORI2]BDU57288.1 hypothetical protein LMORI2_02700 [Limnohabitans sp. MORI2]
MKILKVIEYIKSVIDRFQYKDSNWKINVTDEKIFKTTEKVLIYVIHIHGCFIPKFMINNVEYWRAKGFTPVLVITYSNVNKLSMMDILEKNLPECNYFIRDNRGKDFGGIGDLCRKFDLTKCEQILLMNDSFIGPFYDSNLFERLSEVKSDVVGVTESFEILYHLQSSLIYIKNSKSISHFINFFIKKYKPYNSRMNIIREGEIGLTQYFLSNGVSVRALYNIPHLLTNYSFPGGVNELTKINSQHYFGENIFIHEGFPYLKRELLTRNQMKLSINYGEIMNKLNSIERDNLNEAIIARV